MKRILSLVTVGISAIVLMLVAFAAPSFAANPSSSGGVTASATIPSSITLSGLTDIPFGNVNAGSSATAPESYTVMTNDPAGYVLTISSNQGELTTSAGASGPSINDNALSVAETSPPDGTVPASWNFSSYTPGIGGSFTIDSTSVAATNTYHETWTFHPGGTVVPGSYSQQFTFVATAN